jgi:hypothetical protein
MYNIQVPAIARNGRIYPNNNGTTIGFIGSSSSSGADLSNYLKLSASTTQKILTGICFAGGVSGITKTTVGLNLVDNTSDACKSVCYAQIAGSAANATYAVCANTGITALNSFCLGGSLACTYAKLNSPVFTGTVCGISKGMIGLCSVDNTPDSSKCVCCSIVATNAGNSNYLYVNDTRNTITTPQTINQCVTYDFKTNTCESLNDGGTYFGEMTFRQYGNTTDWTGGKSHQLGFTDNGSIWHRSGQNTTWGTWYKLYQTCDTVACATVASTANNSLALCGCVPNCFLAVGGTAVCATRIYTPTYDNTAQLVFNTAGSGYVGLAGNVANNLSIVRYNNPDGLPAHVTSTAEIITTANISIQTVATANNSNYATCASTGITALNSFCLGGSLACTYAKLNSPVFTGNVGFGVTPSYKVDVYGDIHNTGSFITQSYNRAQYIGNWAIANYWGIGSIGSCDVKIAPTQLTGQFTGGSVNLCLVGNMNISAGSCYKINGTKLAVADITGAAPISNPVFTGYVCTSTWKFDDTYGLLPIATNGDSTTNVGGSGNRIGVGYFNNVNTGSVTISGRVQNHLKVLYNQITQDTYVNSSAEHTVMSFTVPAGVMGSQGVLRITNIGSIIVGTSAQTIRVRIKFGGTTLYDAITGNIGVGTYTYRLDSQIENLSASSQISQHKFIVGLVGTGTPKNMVNITASSFDSGGTAGTANTANSAVFEASYQLSGTDNTLGNDVRTIELL